MLLPMTSNITAESANGEQNVDYSGVLKDGDGAADLKAVVEKLQEIANDGSLRMQIGELGFPTGQALIDWLKAGQKPFVPSYERQESPWPKLPHPRPAKPTAWGSCPKKAVMAF